MSFSGLSDCGTTVRIVNNLNTNGSLQETNSGNVVLPLPYKMGLGYDAENFDDNTQERLKVLGNSIFFGDMKINGVISATEVITPFKSFTQLETNNLTVYSNTFLNNTQGHSLIITGNAVMNNLTVNNLNVNTITAVVSNTTTNDLVVNSKISVGDLRFECNNSMPIFTQNFFKGMSMNPVRTFQFIDSRTSGSDRYETVVMTPNPFVTSTVNFLLPHSWSYVDAGYMLSGTLLEPKQEINATFVVSDHLQFYAKVRVEGQFIAKSDFEVSLWNGNLPKFSTSFSFIDDIFTDDMWKNELLYQAYLATRPKQYKMPDPDGYLEYYVNMEKIINVNKMNCFRIAVNRTDFKNYSLRITVEFLGV